VVLTSVEILAVAVLHVACSVAEAHGRARSYSSNRSLNDIDSCHSVIFSGSTQQPRDINANDVLLHTDSYAYRNAMLILVSQYTVLYNCLICIVLCYVNSLKTY
jgi:hypothetical protein